VLAALGAGASLVTLLVLGDGDPVWWHRLVAAASALVTLVVLARLLLSGHLEGTGLRAARRRHRVEAVGQRREQVAEPGAAERVEELVVARLRRGVAQVGPDGVVEQVPVLRDHPDRAAQR